MLSAIVSRKARFFQGNPKNVLTSSAGRLYLYLCSGISLGTVGDMIVNRQARFLGGVHKTSVDK